MLFPLCFMPIRMMWVYRFITRTIQEILLVLKVIHRYSYHMSIISLFIICFLPVALWIVYCVHFLRFSYFSTLRAVLFALFAVIVVAGVQWIIDPYIRGIVGFPGRLFACFVTASLIEETVKLMTVRFLPETFSYNIARQVLLGYAVLIGLSFASFETLMYAIHNPSILFIRSFTTVFVHASGTLLCAAALLRRRKSSLALAGTGLFFSSVILHGLYNLCMEFDYRFLLPGLCIVLIMIGLAVRQWLRAEESFSCRE